MWAVKGNKVTPSYVDEEKKTIPPKYSKSVPVPVVNGDISVPVPKSESPKPTATGEIPATPVARVRKKHDQSAGDTDLADLIEKRENARYYTPFLHIRRQELHEAKLQEKPVQEAEGIEGWKQRRKMNAKKLNNWKKELLYKLELWGGFLKKIEGHQGTGVVSYFTFLRTLFLLNCVIFVLVFLFITIPVLAFSASEDWDYHVIGDGSVGGVDPSNSAVCSTNYSVTTSSAAADVVKDFLQGTGWMEQTAMFYGWYYPSDLDLGTAGSTSFNYTTPLAYLLTSVIVFIISLVFMARSTVSSFKEQLARNTEAGKFTYSTKIFCAWDYAMMEEGPTLNKHKAIQKDIVAELAEDKFKKQRKNMTTGQKCTLYTVRFLINFIILCMLGGAGYLIYFVQDFSTSYTTSDNLLELLVQYLPAITLGGLNGILPLIFLLLVKAEQYTPEFVLKIHLFRIVFLKLASLAILVITMYSLITCGTKDTTCNVNTGSCTEIKCWETYAGQTFYKLIFTDTLVPFIVVFGVELPRKLLTTKCDSKLLKKIGPAEFDIPKSVLDLVFSQMLLWIGFVFAPMVTPIVVISFFTQFYLKLFSALYTTGPAEKPYKAARSNSFFMVILMVGFFLCVFPVGYAMVKMTPSKGCGPFRIYSSMSVIVDVTIDNFPTWLNTILTLITSASFILTIIVVLILVIYYCSAVATANQDTVKLLEEQLIMESKDKQFLMAKLYDATGEKGHISRKKPPPPAPVNSEKAQLVNETSKYDDTQAEEIKLLVPTTTNVPAAPNYRTPSPAESKDGRRSISPRLLTASNQGNPVDF